MMLELRLWHTGRGVSGRVDPHPFRTRLAAPENVVAHQLRPTRLSSMLPLRPSAGCACSAHFEESFFGMSACERHDEAAREQDEGWHSPASTSALA